MTRRGFLGALAVAPAIHARQRPALRVESIHISYEDYDYRTPMKWGKAVITRASILNVACVARTNAGKTVHGFGSMKMGNTWAFRTDVLTYDQTLDAMKALAVRIGKLTESCRESAHPVELNYLVEPSYLKVAAAVAKDLRLPEPIPKLCTLVTASAFDAAVHDAYGKANGLNCFRTYGPEFLQHDLSRYLSPEFRGEHLDRYVLPDPVPSLPLYHLVSGADPLSAGDVTKRIDDGLPETLAEWIARERITHFKIKMQGTNLDWDVGRVLAVHRVVEETRKPRMPQYQYSLDFNEMCANVDYLIEFLRRVKEKAPAAFDAIQYIEQPTKRDLQSDRANVMHRAVKYKPVVIDESLTDYETLVLAREMGYSGIALKACKGQSQSLLMAAAAQKYKMFRCVQDLTCPGASLVHSAGLAAHVPGVAAIEANARQFCPAANTAWAGRFPGLFKISDGILRTGDLNKPGLSAVS